MPLTPEELKRYRKTRLLVITAQCLGTFPYVLLDNSPVIILYTALLGCSEFVGIITTSFTGFARFLITPFVGILVDRIGKKKVLIPAMAVAGAAFGGMALVPYIPLPATVSLLGIALVYMFGLGFTNAAWFPLLKDNVPAELRGGFFGTMRAAWNGASMVYIFLISWWIGKHATLGQLQLVLAATGAMVLVKTVMMLALPEKDTRTPDLKLRDVLGSVMRQRDLQNFCVYVFVLYLLVGGIVPLVYLLARGPLGMPDNYVVNLTSIMTGASILGFIAGGIVNDRIGAKSIFLYAHFGFGAICLLLLSVNAGMPAAYNTVAVAALLALFGFFYSASSIAITTQLFALSRGTIQATAMSLGMAMYTGGTALSRIGTGWVLDRGMLSASWHLFGMPLTAYHTVFLIAGCGVIGAVILLTLVPAIMEKTWVYPRV